MHGKRCRPVPLVCAVAVHTDCANDAAPIVPIMRTHAPTETQGSQVSTGGSEKISSRRNSYEICLEGEMMRVMKPPFV